jgi:hypothetical protein
MNRFIFWQRWLLAVGLAVAAFGIFMALFNGTSAFNIFNDQIDPVFWGTDGPSPAALDFQRWVYGAWGATVSGWGTFLVFIARYPFRNRDKRARSYLLLGLAVWFIVDTAASLQYRVYFNAFFNLGLLMLAGLPLICTWKVFDQVLSIEL